MPGLLVVSPDCLARSKSESIMWPEWWSRISRNGQLDELRSYGLLEASHLLSGLRSR